jgi:hypothetical protein
MSRSILPGRASRGWLPALALLLFAAGSVRATSGGPELVTAALNGGPAFAPAPSGFPSISGDGTLVAFSTDSVNFAPGPPRNWRDVFVKTLATGALVCVSQAGDGTRGNNHSDAPAFSVDGRFVAFQSTRRISSRGSRLPVSRSSGRISKPALSTWSALLRTGPRGTASAAPTMGSP